MAIDFMIMPLSRYIAGDFVTPMMRYAWENGTQYVILGPQGKKELPPNVPFGGEQAPARRKQIANMVLDDVRALPLLRGTTLWDELSEVEPRFHRVDPKSFEALLQHPEPTALRRLLSFGRAKKLAHCNAGLFLPIPFSAPFRAEAPLNQTYGSTEEALNELAGGRFSPEAQSAVETLTDALRDSSELRLPMIIDL